MPSTNSLANTSFFLPLLCIFLGSSVGLGIFTFNYAEGTSYFGSDSQSCANCHVMQGHYDAWVKSSHGKFAQCNDCHAPHGVAGKFFCKARNGFFHSLAFTMGDFPDQILMHEYNQKVVEENCRYCHTETVHAIDIFDKQPISQNTLSCLHCHSGVGHDQR